MECKHQPQSLWRERTLCLKCGQKLEANGPFWMNYSVHLWIFYVLIQTLRRYGLLPWIDTLSEFWTIIVTIGLPLIPATAILLVYRRYFSPYDVIEDPATRKQYL